MKGSPILLPDGAFEADRVAKAFEADAAGIDPKVTRFVLGKLLLAASK